MMRWGRPRRRRWGCRISWPVLNLRFECEPAVCCGDREVRAQAMRVVTREVARKRNVCWDRRLRQGFRDSGSSELEHGAWGRNGTVAVGSTRRPGQTKPRPVCPAISQASGAGHPPLVLPHAPATMSSQTNYLGATASALIPRRHTDAASHAVHLASHAVHLAPHDGARLGACARPRRAPAAWGVSPSEQAEDDRLARLSSVPRASA